MAPNTEASTPVSVGIGAAAASYDPLGMLGGLPPRKPETASSSKVQSQSQGNRQLDDQHQGGVQADAKPQSAEEDLQRRFEARGVVDMRKRDYTSAERAFLQALSLAEKRLGDDHVDLCLLHGRVADALYHQSKFAAAEDPMRRVIALNEKHRGPEHIETARAVNNLATLLRKQGKSDDALPLMERALEVSEAALGMEHVNTIRTLGNYVELLDEAGDLDGSEELLRKRADAASEAAQEFQHQPPPTAIAGTVFDNSGKKGSEAVLDSAARSKLAMSAKARSRLAGVLLSHGKAIEASEQYVTALADADAAYSPEHPEAATIAGSLAHCYRTLGRLALAEPLFERLLECTEATLGPKHMQTAAVANSLATLYREQCKYGAAEPFHARAVAAARAAAGDSHPSVADLLISHALTLKALGRTKQAKRLVEEAHRIRQASQVTKRAHAAQAKVARSAPAVA